MGGQAVEEVPDGRERTGMSHVKPGHGRSFVSRSILQGTVQLPDVTRLGQSGEHALPGGRHVAGSPSCRMTTSPGRERAPVGSPSERPVAAGSIDPRE